MRGVLALVAVTGCGRIAFDPRSDGARDAMVDAPLVCPPGYTKDGGSCYRAGVGTATWLLAEMACEADGIGAHLVEVSDAAEAAIVDKYRPSVTDAAWIGATDLAFEGNYRTITNRTMRYLPWGPVEPEGATQDCLVLAQNLAVADADCANPDDYICEYDGIPASSVALGGCPNGYTFFELGCYRFVDGGSTGTDWFNAEAACEADGAGSHLVVLDDGEEADVVDSFVPSNILDHFIGATDIVNEGTFVTVLGKPIAYTTFDTDEPNGGTTQNCLLYDDANFLNDKECDVGEDYVCEYDGRAPVPAAWGQ